MARRQSSIAGQLFALQAVVVTLLVLVGAAGAVWLARDDSRHAAEEEVLAVAQTVARAPHVRAALTSPDPAASLQPYAEATRLATGTRFVVVMAPDRTRYSHPNPDLIGRPFIGEIGPALAGEPFTTTNVGTLGESVRAVVPVYGDDGRIIGLVSVGITTQAINRKLLAKVPVLLGAAAPALALAATGSWLLSRRLRRQTHGLGPAQMTRMYEYYDAVLHSVREGLVVLTRDRRVALVNDEGRRLLGLDDDAAVTDQPVAGIDLPPAVAELLTSGRDAHDEPVLAGDRVLVANQRTTRFEGTVLGTVLTLRDQTELRNLASELDSVRALTEALQAQTHESANRLHTVLTLVELGRADEAVRLATRDLELAQQLTDRVVGAVTEPALAALLLGKSARAGERGIDLVIEPDCRLDDSPLPTADLLTVVGNLVDNALEAVAGTPPPRRVRVFVGVVEDEIVIRIGDSGPGLAPDRVADAFRRGWSTKSAGRGLGLALVGQVVNRHGGRSEVGRSEEGGTLFTVRLPIKEDRS
ncbi:two-component system, CitB family, sensor kinase [Micromonospora rhizosphaerae]|uniref:histidine kinase n=1 Tax=Micromonospora rhizosphaerae TaxID=568872 RepID=A0A1C6S5M9_9ACTN|nr:sensor histidine kinase [Micromonospora rhizosphaerae]SCL24774.1 two-component system, CitB family, sensor kinase [Micromonospora rhizosphaerae]